MVVDVFFRAKNPIRLSDWSICTTWYKMLLSDWLVNYTAQVYYLQFIFFFQNSRLKEIIRH